MSNPTRMLDLNQDGLTIPPGTRLHKLPWIGLGLGLAGMAGSAFLAQGHMQEFLYAWLVAFLFFLSIALGGLFFVLVLFATKAGWGVSVRRLAEHAMATLPIFALLFLPIAWGAGQIFSWWEGPGDDALLALKEPYLNSGFFLARAATYFIVWSAIALWFASRSARQDISGEHSITRRLQAASGPCLILYAFTVTFASIDWIMALDPHWYSTMFGIYFFSGCLVGIFAFLVLAVGLLQEAGYVKQVIHKGHYHTLGMLLFAFMVFWAYIAFSQYFLIWYANIPEETIWYLHRMHGTWSNLSLILAVGHFGIPFFFLMPRAIKENPRLLMAGAAWMLLMHLADIYWLVMPNLYDHGPHFGLLDVAALASVGGIFMGAFGWSLRRHALIPVKDPRLPESLQPDHA